MNKQAKMAIESVEHIIQKINEDKIHSTSIESEIVELEDGSKTYGKLTYKITVK